MWLCLEFIALGLESRRDQKIMDFSFKNFSHYKNKIAVLVFGSSHALYGVNPQYFDEFGYNFSYSAEDIFYSYMKLRRYINEMPNLKTVMLCVDYFSPGYFERKSQFREISYGYGGYIPEQLSLRGYFERLSAFFRVRPWFADSFKRKYLKREDIKIAENEGNLSDNYSVFPGIADQTMLASGYFYTNRDRPELKTSEGAEKQTRIFAVDNYDQERVHFNEGILNKFIGLCEKKRVRVILFTPPYTEAYRKAYPCGHITVMRNMVKKAMRGHDNAAYYDYSASEAFAAEDFLDSDHLNAKGAEKFSKLLNNNLKLSVKGSK